MSARVSVIIALLLLTVAPGCAPLIYAYPKISHFPAVDLRAECEEVHPYLVHTKRTEYFGYFLPPTKQEFIPLDWPNGTHSRSVTKISLKYWMGIVCALSHGDGLEHKYERRLYRPGYKLVVLEPWEKQKQIQWEEAATIAERKETLDQLLSGDWFHPNSILASNRQSLSKVPCWVPPGSENDPVEGKWAKEPKPEPLSTSQQEEVLYLAAEYARLAESMARGNEPQNDGFVNELREKAAWLRGRATDSM